MCEHAGMPAAATASAWSLLGDADHPRTGVDRVWDTGIHYLERHGRDSTESNQLEHHRQFDHDFDRDFDRDFARLSCVRDKRETSKFIRPCLLHSQRGPAIPGRGIPGSGTHQASAYMLAECRPMP